MHVHCAAVPAGRSPTAARRSSLPRRLPARTHGSASSELILRQGSPASGSRRGAGSGEERSERARRGAGSAASAGTAGTGVRARAGDAAGERSERLRARATSSRLAGVTSLSERKCRRRRAPGEGAGESASVTLMLMLCLSAGLGSALPREHLPFSLMRGLRVPFLEFFEGPARLGPAPAS